MFNISLILLVAFFESFMLIYYGGDIMDYEDWIYLYDVNKMYYKENKFTDETELDKYWKIILMMESE